MLGRDFVRAVISFVKFAASGKVQAKKNLGLMQMQYKDVYVAYVSMGANWATEKCGDGSCLYYIIFTHHRCAAICYNTQHKE